MQNNNIQQPNSEQSADNGTKPHVSSTWRGMTCPHCQYETDVDPALITDESPMPYCPNCEGALFGEDEDDCDDEDNFQECDDCDGHDACRDFGCAVKAGLGHLLPPRW